MEAATTATAPKKTELAAAAPPSSASWTYIRVWDLPTRLFHWLLVAGVGTSWWTAEAGQLAWHRYSGCAVLALLVFRVYWGCFGSSTARFRDFVRGPREVWAYARDLHLRTPSFWVGHNPVAGLGVLALLTLIVVQVGLGLFAVDIDGLESGPLSYLVSFETGRTLARGHRLVFGALCWMMALHVGAVLFYCLYKRDDLIEGMVRGRRRVPSGTRVGARIAPSWRVLPGLLLALAVVWLVSGS